MSHISTRPTATQLAANDLSDAVGTVEHIFEAANALFGRVSENVIALENFPQYEQLRAQLGPVSGLAWTMSELEDGIARVRELIDALQDSKA